ncbi:MAG: hypothetical protein BGN96_05665 [Bacteroidales bacterium 45-6]|nr:MAG: hypothetical protein BGN96_05665 [Bacteroidales bacterium 45-6]
MQKGITFYEPKLYGDPSGKFKATKLIINWMIGRCFGKGKSKKSEKRPIRGCQPWGEMLRFSSE